MPLPVLPTAPSVLRGLVLSSTLAAAPAPACELALLFALDVSASVDPREYRIQFEGLAEALITPQVAESILAQEGGVALAAYEWSGTGQQAVVAPWRHVTELGGLLAMAEQIAGHERQYDQFPTAIGNALGFGALMFREAPRCRRKVIDVSGDGVMNDGYPPVSAYRAFDFTDITVNGLAIAVADHENEGQADADVARFYLTEVIYGPAAFLETANGFDDYARAIRRKLLREVWGERLAELR